MKFKVEYIVHPEESGGYSVEFPWMPGCVTDADNLEEAHTNAREAAEGWLECMLEDHSLGEIFRYDPWDFECAPGEQFEIDVDIKVPSVAYHHSSSTFRPTPALATP